MEASGVVFRPLPCFPGAGSDARSHSSLSSQSVSLRLVSFRELRARKFRGFSNSGFCDSGHVEYYGRSAVEAIRCDGGKKEKEKEVSPKKMMKERLKLLKGLSRDLSKFSALDFGLDPQNHGLMDEVKGTMISEATNLLLGQLQQLKAEEKELKRKRKEERAKLKAAKMQNQNRLECESSSSSSSSDSSDRECRVVVDMSSLKSEVLAPAGRNGLLPAMQGTSFAFPSTMTQEGKTNEFQPVVQEAIITVPSPMNQVGRMTQESGVEYSLRSLQRECYTPTSTSFAPVGIGGSCDGRKSVAQAPAGRIEVCMGGKCKKSGAATLLEEFQKILGSEGDAVGCKCMGKCKDGPNVRVTNGSDGAQAQGTDTSVRVGASANPLCIGVGFEDVGLIVSNFFRAAQEEDRDLAASS